MSSVDQSQVLVFARQVLCSLRHLPSLEQPLANAELPRPGGIPVPLCLRMDLALLSGHKGKWWKFEEEEGTITSRL